MLLSSRFWNRDRTVHLWEIIMRHPGEVAPAEKLVWYQMVASRPKPLDDCSQLCDAGRGWGLAEAHHVSCGKRNHWLTCMVRS